MSNYVPLYDAVAAQHQRDLLREAEQERLAREATAGMEGSAYHAMRGMSRQVLATAGLLAALVTGGLAACGAQATAKPHVGGAKPAASQSTSSNSDDQCFRKVHVRDAADPRHVMTVCEPADAGTALPARGPR